MDDAEAFAALLTFLEADGAVSDDRDRGVVTIVRYGDARLDEPLRLHLTPSTLGEVLRSGAESASSVFPDVEPVRAAWQLFTVHVEEAIHTAGDGRTELVPDRYGVRPVSPEELLDTPTVEEQESFASLVEHLAERGDVVADRRRGPITILRYGEVVFEPPLRWDLSPRTLGRHLRSTTLDRRSLLAAVDDAVAAVRPGDQGLVLNDDGTVTVIRSAES